MPFAEANGIHTHYEITGHAGLPVLTFSHSLGADLDMWLGQVDSLNSYFQILRYDARGHGQSATASGPASIADMGRDVLGLLDALNVQTTSFCGISMGGLIGQWLGIHAPHRVDKLVLANTATKIGNTESWNTRIATVQQEGLQTIVDGTLERWFIAGFREEHPEVVDGIRAGFLKTDPAGYAACCAAIRDADFRNEVCQIASPTLVIAGSADPVTTLADGQFLASQIASASYVEVKAAHLSNLGAADFFNEALRGFFNH